jgi:hypothetical protein
MWNPRWYEDENENADETRHGGSSGRLCFPQTLSPTLIRTPTKTRPRRVRWTPFVPNPNPTLRPNQIQRPSPKLNRRTTQVEVGA